MLPPRKKKPRWLRGLMRFAFAWARGVQRFSQWLLGSSVSMLRRCRLVVGIHPKPSNRARKFRRNKDWHTKFCVPKVLVPAWEGGRTAAHSEVGEPFSHFDRLCGGGQTDLIEGLRQLLQHADTSNHSDANLISGMEHLIAWARSQSGFNLLDGLQKLVSKEIANRGRKAPEGKRKEKPHKPWDTPAPARRVQWADSTWQEVRWKPRITDWTSPVTDSLHLVCGPDEFSTALDNHKDSAFVVLASSFEDFTQCVALAHTERHAFVSILLPTAFQWPDGEDKPCTVRIPGLCQRALQTRLCYMTTFADGSPVLGTKKKLEVPSVQRAQSTFGHSKAKRNAGVVLRFVAPMSFQDVSWPVWENMCKSPGAYARRWALALDPNCANLLGDTFHFELQDPQTRHSQLRGLLRVYDEKVARQLLESAGSKHAEIGQRWYVDQINSAMDLPSAVHWVQWQDGEKWDTYASRVSRMSEHGAVHGRHQLGIRVQKDDPRIVDRASV